MTADKPEVIFDDEDLLEMSEGMDEDEAHELEQRYGIEATEQPTDDKLQFHVQMKGWQQDAFEETMLDVAASQFVRRLPRDFEKRVEARALEMFGEAVNAKLEPITREILDQPLSPLPFSKKPTLTMAEYIGLTGREYLSQKVGTSGKPVDPNGYGVRNETPRINYIVREILNAKFSKDIEAETSRLIREVQQEVRAAGDAMIAAEKARIAAALAKATA